MSTAAKKSTRLIYLLVLLAVAGWGFHGWLTARQARRAGRAFERTLISAWDKHGCPPLAQREKIVAAAGRIGTGDFRSVVATLGPAEPLTAARQAAAQRFFAESPDHQKRFIAAAKAAQDQEADGADAGAVRDALSQAMAAAADGDADAVADGVDRAEAALDQVGMGPAAGGADNAATVAGLVGRVGPAYNLGREFLTEGHAAARKLVAGASRRFKAQEYSQAASLVQLAAALLGVDVGTPVSAVTPKWFDALADEPVPEATPAEAEAAVNLCEAMAMSEEPARPVRTLIDKARRELDAGRTADAYWWAAVALNALGMTDEAVAAATRPAEEKTDEP